MPGTGSRVTHHDLCFGCGTANLFGLQMEMEPAAGGGVAGRFFVKQDHQGPSGEAHPGVIGAALEEAMSLALEAEGLRAGPAAVETEVESAAPVGAFVRVSARVEAGASGERTAVRAEAELAGAEGRPVATSRGLFAVRASG